MMKYINTLLMRGNIFLENYYPVVSSKVFWACIVGLKKGRTKSRSMVFISFKQVGLRIYGILFSKGIVLRYDAAVTLENSHSNFTQTCLNKKALISYFSHSGNRTKL